MRGWLRTATRVLQAPHARVLTGCSRPPAIFARRCFSGLSSLAGAKLKDLVKLDLFEKEEAKTCAAIWLQHHDQSPHAVGQSVSVQFLHEILECATARPMFLFPVYRGEGHMMVVSQFSSPGRFLFTYLEDFKVNPQAAPPYMVVTAYDDLAVSKHLGLFRGDFDPQFLSKQEASRLLSLLLHFHTHPGSKAITAFNDTPNEFDFQRYLNSVSKLV